MYAPPNPGRESHATVLAWRCTWTAGRRRRRKDFPELAYGRHEMPPAGGPEAWHSQGHKF
jgi:hypothetical protein